MTTNSIEAVNIGKKYLDFTLDLLESIPTLLLQQVY